VNLSPSTLLAHARTDAGKRAIRYSATSLICVALTQVLILVFYKGFRWTEVRSNLTATMLVSIPAFILNKYWVWGKRGRAHVRREVIPFWLFTVAGWALSTGAVALVSRVGEPHSLVRTLSVMVASIAGFGVLWVLKYLFLDKIMFGPDHHTPYDEDIELEEAALEASSAHDA
jgi:putative flippase GtrA